MIAYFKNKNHKSKKRYKNYKTLNTILESVDSIVIIAATSTSITLSVVGIGLVILPISAGIACTLSLGNKILHKLILNKYNKYKKQYERDQQTIKSFDKLYRKSLQDNLIDKGEYESLCNILLPNDRVQAIPADIGNTIKPIPVNDRVIEIDVGAIITIESTDSNIVFRVL